MQILCRHLSAVCPFALPLEPGEKRYWRRQTERTRLCKASGRAMGKPEASAPCMGCPHAIGVKNHGNGRPTAAGTRTKDTHGYMGL